ncbi:hypothetical protein OROGR_000394 [Orobanche gracilis]
MMWALEYDPDLFSMYENHQSVFKKPEGSEGKAKSRRQCGKFERENLRNRRKYGSAPSPLSVFLVASVLKDKSSKLTEARGLDEVVKILNDITGNLDAKRACVGAMKLHKKYLEKFMPKTPENSASGCLVFRLSVKEQLPRCPIYQYVQLEYSHRL